MNKTGFELGTRVQIALLLIGILAISRTAYYSGSTGNWLPLIMVSITVGILYLFTS